MFQKIEPCAVEGGGCKCEIENFDEVLLKREVAEAAGSDEVGKVGNVHAAMGYDGRRLTSENK